MKSKIKIICFLWALLFTIGHPVSLKAQFGRSGCKSNNTVYIEVGGEALTPVSVHFDKVLFGFRDSYATLNFGVGYFAIAYDDLDPLFGVPIGFSWNSSQKNNHLEIGGGLCYSSGLEQSYENNGSKIEKRKIEAIFATTRVGYRYQKPKGGFFFKIGFTPAIKIVDLGDSYPFTIKPMVGVAFGFSF